MIKVSEKTKNRREMVFRRAIRKFNKTYREIKIIPSNALNNDFVRLHEKVADLTKHIDYNCGFEDGRCSQRRKDQRESLCCCDGCKEHVGHYNRIPEWWIPIISQYWSDRNGFYSKKGCKLPRNLRSSTCLGFACPERVLNREKKVSAFERGFLNIFTSEPI